MKAVDKIQGYTEEEIECHMGCGFKGRIKLFKTQGGVIYENLDRVSISNRVNIYGVCPKCDATLISYHITEDGQGETK